MQVSDVQPEWLSWINPSIHVAWQGRWRRGHVEPTRYLPDHELVVFTQGSCVAEVNGRTYHCEPNTFLIVPPNHQHLTLANSGKVHRYCVHFDWLSRPEDGPRANWVWKNHPISPSMIRDAPRWIPAGPMHGHVQTGREVIALLETLMTRWAAGGNLNRAACRATLLEVLLRLLHHATNRTHPPDRSLELALRVKMLLDGVEDHRVGLTILLAPLGYSYEHLSRLFRDAFGLSPLAYLNQQRLERAKVLLHDPSLRIAAVARLVGFEDANYFSRVFRRHTGMPPRRYTQLVTQSE